MSEELEPKMDERNKVVDLEDNKLLEENNSSSDSFELPLGDALTAEQTYPITAANKTHFVVLAGPSACGKTTLVTTLYQMFQNGPVGEYYFAGSHTLKGFEQRAFLSRTDSEGSTPQTQKTRRGMYDSILHLDLWNSSKNQNHHFLISDFSGEEYDSAVANVNLMKNDFSIIKSADIIVLLIDGDRVSKKQYRNGVVQNVHELLQTINDADLIGKNTRIYIVLSKYDIIKNRCQKDSSINDFIKKLNSRFENRFAKLNNSIDFFQIAAMPETDLEFEMGYGLKELLFSWMNPHDSHLYNINQPISPMLSEFNKFKRRILEMHI